MAKNTLKKKQAGVTLLEILVAMVILTVGLIFVYEIFPLGFKASFRSKNRTISTQLGQQVLDGIVRNQDYLSCLKNQSRLCRFGPPEIGAEHLDYFGQIISVFLPFGDQFECSYYTGNPFTTWEGDYRTRGGSNFCRYDTGVIDDPDNWIQFDAPNDNFWYHVEVTPVLDPAANFPAFDSSTHRVSLYRDWWNLARITVRVRGPVNDMANWALVNSPTEIVLSTFVSGKRLASTRLIADETGFDDNPKVNRIPDNNINGIPDEVCFIKMRNMRNFPFFNQLTHEEKNDPSWVFRIGDGADPDVEVEVQVGNARRMDNVIIEKVNRGADFYGSRDDDTYLYQTNKILSIWPMDMSDNPERGFELEGYALLAQPFYFEDYKNDPGTYFEENCMIEGRGTYGPYADPDTGDIVDGVYVWWLWSDETVPVRFDYNMYQLVTIPKIDSSTGDINI